MVYKKEKKQLLNQLIKLEYSSISYDLFLDFFLLLQKQHATVKITIAPIIEINTIAHTGMTNPYLY